MAVTQDTMNKSQSLYAHAKKLMPGGTQILSKRPELFLPEQWPAYYAKAKGCEVWDLDGKKYVDMNGMGVNSCLLGYADDDVSAAVRKTLENGAMSSLNPPEEVELAEVLLALHPWARMVRYARTGGEATAVAVRIARARTGKDTVLFCGYHGWQDWYLASNLADDKSLDGHLLPGLVPNGVPRGLKGTAFPFKYNDIDGFMHLLSEHKGKIAAVVMEPIRSVQPLNGFLEKVREATRAAGIVLVFDDITAGWRLCVGGSHLLFKVYPDICVFSKAMANGHPMAAVIGTEDAMQAAQDTFISSTYWSERVGPTAALATIKKLKERDVPRHLAQTGRKVQDGWRKAAARHKLEVNAGGLDPMGWFGFKYERPLVLKTLFTQLMLERGYLAATGFTASYAHTDAHVERYLGAVDEAFAFIARAISDGAPEKHLKGPVCHAGFARLA